MAIANQEGNFRTQEFILNMGPQHPSTHGVYRAIITLDGEYVVDLENVVGYLHRGMEKLAESRTYTQFIPYTDRMDYLAGMLNNWGYVLTLEKALELEIPERAEYIRVIVGELQRIASHLVMVSSMALDMNGYTAWMYAFYDRELILDLFEMICGSRLTTSYMRVGGVPNDIPEGFIPKLEEFIKIFPKRLDDFDNVITGNEIFIGRTKNVAPIDGETALNYGLTGPNLRASGVDFDLRKVRPYSIYDRFDFEVPVGELGDNFERYNMRMLEMRQSLRIVQQALDQLPEGEIMAKVPKSIKIPPGETYGHIEGSKGILGYYLVSDGGTKPYRMHVRAPSYVNLGIYPLMSKGTIFQDAIASLASIDIVLGEVDR